MEPITPIGVIRSPRTDFANEGWGTVTARIELDPDVFATGATDGLTEYSHVEVVYAFHLSTRTCTADQHPRQNPAWPRTGILAQRAPNRPNHLGVTICELIAADALSLTVRGLDAVDGSPLLDVKPYLREFAPRGPLRQPDYTGELMRDYF
jgi:tRNA-Thr(GGU) m(6)t(6)A37 methyltransferase TsaA